MRVELERIEGKAPEGIPDAEIYRVLAIEDTGTPTTLQIGTVTRVSGPTWSLMLKPEKSEGEPIEVVLKADTVDELKAAIRDRFGLLDLSADRLADNTMADFGRELLRPVSTLATSTHTIAGFTSALVYHLALIGAVDVAPEGREKYVDAISGRLKTELASIVEMNNSRGVLNGALRDMLDKLMNAGGGKHGGPTKH